ncbi:hypothetical protein SETIT_2G329100v2 [Setaria italica]|uniref:Uncharacterized protein n=1 Tax=Setaria italica TaxID=4555 RepID=A0A368Q5B2_SETIT|nr:hypothetical protein SETIT_2G329100v2 [Setaria italica]
MTTSSLCAGSSMIPCLQLQVVKLSRAKSIFYHN